MGMKATVVVAACLVVGLAAAAQDAEPEPVPTRNYGPYPDNRVLFGDTHLHTSYSNDAGLMGLTLGPEEAFRFARGDEVKSTTGQRAKLRRPLDFLVVSDHAEDLGLALFIQQGDPRLLADPLGKKWYDMSKAGKGKRGDAEDDE